MWDPLLKRQLSDCIPLHAQLVHGAPEVYGILHSSVHRATPGDEGRAQQGIAAVYGQLPHVAVAMQADIWSGDPGHAVLKAIESAREPPILISLERDLDRASFDRLHARAVEVTRVTGDFLGVLIDACRAAAASRTSEFAALWCLVEEHERKHGDLHDYLAELVGLCGRAGCALSLDATVLMRLLALSSRLSEETLRLEIERLEQDVTARASAGALSSRSVIELYAYERESRAVPGDGSEQVVAMCQLALALPDAEADEEMLRAVCDTIERDYVFHGVSVSAGEQHRPNMGGGEVVSRLVELAPLLDIDVNRYPSLPLYVHYSHLLHALETSGTTGLGVRIGGAIERLEDDLCAALPRGADDHALAELLPAVTLMHTLRRGLIGFDASDVDALIDFSATAMLATLAELGCVVAPEWAAQAVHADEQMRVVAEFSQRAEQRGRQMALELHGELVARGIASAVLLFEGYLCSSVLDGLARDVAYTMLIPTA